MAPEDTRITAVPRARAAATSAATPCSQAVRGAAPSTTSALPILTTSSLASARPGTITPGTRAPCTQSISRRSCSGTPWPLTPDISATGWPEARASAARRAEASRGLIASALFSTISSGLSARPPP